MIYSERDMTYRCHVPFAILNLLPDHSLPDMCRRCVTQIYGCAHNHQPEAVGGMLQSQLLLSAAANTNDDEKKEKTNEQSRNN
jgi:hypothetical protein